MIVFSEQLATVVYIETALTQLRPQLRVGCTVKMQTPGTYKMKRRREIDKILAAFAPIAQQTKSAEGSYDILLTTDAFGVGVNLQDAQVVVNYDLAWTPIEPAQRAGRILRFWPSPRGIEVYVFKPIFSFKETFDIVYGHATQGMIRRWDKLSQRHGETIPLLDLPTLPTHVHQELDMSSLAGSQEVIEELRLEDLSDEDLGVSSIFRHTSVLEQYRQDARTIPDDIVSALEYSGEHPLIYVLLKYNEKHYWPVYDIKRKRVLIWPDVTLLNRIECRPDTPPAGVDPNLIEKWSDQCIRVWCDKYGYNVDQVVRICALYLHPQGKAVSFEEWIEDYLERY